MTPTPVRVTAKDIRSGIAGDCFRCAVALAVQRATGDAEANVFEDYSWTLRIEAWSRSVAAPCDVRFFTYNFDGLLRKRTNRAVLPARLEGDVAPFSFTLPADDDPEWDERCYRCEHFCKAEDLDDEGVCDECNAK